MVILRNICVYILECHNIRKREAINFNKRRESYVARFGRKKEKGEMF